MAALLRALPAIISVVLLVYCLIECIQTPEHQCRNLPKMAWVLVIVFLPLVGSVAWLVAGRPVRQTPAAPAGATPYQRPVLAPDDDPQFLQQLKASNAEHEQMLSRWEKDLREREQALRDGKPGEQHPPAEPEKGQQPPDEDPPPGARAG